MSDRSAIEWTDATWNPVTGCTKVSAGCDHCYAETFAERFRGVPGHHYANGFDVQLRPERLDQPLRWRKPRRIFVNSMSDLFHAKVPLDYIADVFAVMGLARQHTFQVLTKRPDRMAHLLKSDQFRDAVGHAGWAFDPDGERIYEYSHPWPFPNVWIGVSVEDQKSADIRIPKLLDTPAAVRFLSCEPLLAPVDLSVYLGVEYMDALDGYGQEMFATLQGRAGAAGGLHWVIAGGESGHGARPMHPDWARTLRDQCQAAEVAFHFKQWGEYLPVTATADDRFLGGLAFDHPDGGRTAAAIRETGPTGTMRTAVTRAMKPGERTNGLVLLDEQTLAVRVGKKRAGRELDGRTWDDRPATPTQAAS